MLICLSGCNAEMCGWLCDGETDKEEDSDGVQLQ